VGDWSFGVRRDVRFQSKVNNLPQASISSAKHTFMSHPPLDDAGALVGSESDLVSIKTHPFWAIPLILLDIGKKVNNFVPPTVISKDEKHTNVIFHLQPEKITSTVASTCYGIASGARRLYSLPYDACEQIYAFSNPKFRALKEKKEELSRAATFEEWKSIALELDALVGENEYLFIRHTLLLFLTCAGAFRK